MPNQKLWIFPKILPAVEASFLPSAAGIFFSPSASQLKLNLNIFMRLFEPPSFGSTNTFCLDSQRALYLTLWRSSNGLTLDGCAVNYAVRIRRICGRYKWCVRMYRSVQHSSNRLIARKVTCLIGAILFICKDVGGMCGLIRIGCSGRQWR